MSALAYFEDVAENSERRSSDRHVLRLETAASISARADTAAVIHDISMEGLLMETATDLPTGASFELALPEAEATVATVVWKRGHYYGCEFAEPLRKAVFSAVLLKNPSLTPRWATAGADGELARDALSGSEMSPGMRFWTIAFLAAAAWALVATLMFALA